MTNGIPPLVLLARLSHTLTTVSLQLDAGNVASAKTELGEAVAQVDMIMKAVK